MLSRAKNAKRQPLTKTVCVNYHPIVIIRPNWKKRLPADGSCNPFERPLRLSLCARATTRKWSYGTRINQTDRRTDRTGQNATLLSLIESRLAFVRFLRGRFQSESVYQLHVGEGECPGELAVELELSGLHVQTLIELVSPSLSFLLFSQLNSVLFQVVGQSSFLVVTHTTHIRRHDTA